MHPHTNARTRTHRYWEVEEEEGWARLMAIMPATHSHTVRLLKELALMKLQSKSFSLMLQGGCVAPVAHGTAWWGWRVVGCT